ncbi:MAG: phenylalanine--tRNA ligase subunit alpha, partial [Candidatus Fonsibacter sp.]
MDEILHLEKEFKSKIDQSDNLHKIEQVKSEAFGKNGKIGELFKKITTLQGEDRKNFASNLNKLKDNINNLINSKISLFEQEEINKKLSQDRIDVTL